MSSPRININKHEFGKLETSSEFMSIRVHSWLIFSALMNPIKGEQLLAQLNWRYATKQFDPAKKISPEDWAVLEDALILSPSSYGLQPWKFIVITDPKTCERLFTATWNQRQVLDCSHYLVFAVHTTMTEAQIDKHIARVIEIRGGTIAGLKRFRDMMVGDVVTGARSAIAQQWATHQAYLALGNFITSAALLGIDTCPMEGFEPEKYDAILDLAANGLTSVVCCAAGYRSPNDKVANQKKVRFPREHMIHIV
jgi:nitroreductase